MFEMDNRLARMQLCQVTDQRVGVDGAAAVLATAGHTLTQQIAFADQRQVIERINKPVFSSTDHQIASGTAGFVQTQDALRRHFDAAEQFAQCFTTPFAFNREDHRAGKGFEELAQVIQRGFILRLHREVRQWLIGQIGVGGFVRQAVRFQLHARPALQLAEEFVSAQPQQLRLEQRAHRVHAAVFKAGTGFTLKTVGAGFQIAGVEHQRIGREIAEQGGQRLAEEQRLPVLDPRRQGAFAHLLINMLGIALDLKLVAPLAAEQFDGGFVGRELVRWQQVDGLHFLQRTLGVSVKQAQAVDLIIEEIQTIRQRATHREEIEQGAAGGVLPVLHHLIHMAITCAVELDAQCIPRQTLALFHHQRMAVQIAVRADALHQGIDRHNQHAALHRGQLIERGQT